MCNKCFGVLSCFLNFIIQLQPDDFDGKEISLSLHEDGELTTVETSSGEGNHDNLINSLNDLISLGSSRQGSLYFYGNKRLICDEFS